jgi:hypothetical protein
VSFIKENTMNNLNKLFLSFFAVAALAFSQTATTSTTLAQAMASGDSTINLASATGVTAADLGPTTGIFVDREYMTVRSLVAGSTLIWNVNRGAAGSIRGPHQSGAKVWIGPPAVFDLGPNDRVGTCTRTSFARLPLVMVRSGTIMDCDVTGKYSPLGIGAFYVPPTACTFVPTTLTQTSTYTYAGASAVFALKGISNAAAGTMTLTCNIPVPTNVSALRGAVVTDITLAIASSATGSGVVPTSVGTSTLTTITLPAAATVETASTITPVAIGGTVTTVSPTAFLSAVSTDGAFFTFKHTYSTAVDLSTDLRLLVYTMPILQSAASISTLFTPGLIVHYRAAI